MDEFNTVLTEIYPDLTEEEQLAVEEAYSQMGVYLEQLDAKTLTLTGKSLSLWDLFDVLGSMVILY